MPIPVALLPKPPHRRFGIHTWAVLLVLAVVVPLLLFGWLTLRAMTQTHAEAFTKTQIDLVRVLASAIDGELHAKKTALTALADSQSLAPGRLAEFYEEARRVAARHDGWIILIDHTGRQQLSTLRPYGTPLPITAAPELLHAVLAEGQPVVGDLLFGNTSQRWVIPVGVPVVRDDRIAYMLVMSFPPEPLTGLLQRQALPAGWSVAIQDSQYRVVTRLPLTAERMGKPVQPWFAAALRSTDQGTVTGPDVTGAPVRVAFHRLAEAPWLTTLAIPLAAFPSARPVQGFVLLGVLLGVGALGLAMYVSRKLTRPVAELAANAERLLQGDVRAAGRVSDVREIQHLQQALVTAATNVQVLQLEQARAAVAEAQVQAAAEAAEALGQSEARYRLLFDRNPDGVFAVDPTGRFILANPACELICGYPLAELLQKSFMELCAPDQLAQTVAHFERHVTQRVYSELETALIRKDGRRVALWVAGEPITADGQLVAVHCTAKDISEHVRAEEALQSVARFADENPSPMLRIARDGTLLYGNRASEPLLRLWGCQVGQPLSEPWRSRMTEAYDRGHVEEVELTCQEHRIYSCVLTPIAAAGYLNLYGRDITVRKHAEAALRTLTTDLERQVQARTADLAQTVKVLQGEIAHRQQVETALERANQLLRVLSACNEALVRLDDEQALMQEICRIVVDLGGYRMAWVGLADDDADRSVRPVAATGFEAGYLESARITWADTDRGRGPTGTAIRLGTVQIGTDFLTELRLAPWRDEALRRGFRSSIALPLRQGEAVFGALTIYAANPAAFPDAQVAVLLELADDLAFGIHAVQVRTALRESRDRLRALTAELTVAEQRERRRLADVLHDGLQQLLVATRLRAHMLAQSADAAVQTGARELVSLLEEALAQTRSLAGELNPPALQQGHLLPALEWLAHWIANKHKLTVQVQPAARPLPTLSVEVAVLLYQAVREFLLNAVKYAQAATAEVTLTLTDRSVSCMVRDAGVGFDPTRLRVGGGTEGGLGLLGIRERLELVGGRLDITSAPGQGSRFTVTVPVAPQEGPARPLPATTPPDPTL